MKELKILVAIVFLIYFVVLNVTQGVPYGITCIRQCLSWQGAVKNCINKGGRLISFKEIGLRNYPDTLNSEIDVWTADYIKHSAFGEELCGFNFLDNTTYQNPGVLYGDCNVSRNYFCKNKTDQNLLIYNSTRGNVRCNETVNINDLNQHRSKIVPGFYWSTFYFQGTEESWNKGMVMTAPTKGQYCGAYKDSIGEYYADCSQKRFSLCTGQTTTNIPKSTLRSSSKENIGTSYSKLSSDKTSTLSKQQMSTLYSTNIELDNKTIQTQIPEDKDHSDIGINVGIPVGLVLPVIGILIVFYIYRKRIKCWHSCKQQHENGRISKKQEPSRIHDKANVYTDSNQDKPNSPDSNAEYAVVMKQKKDTRSSKLEKYSDKTYNNVAYDEYDTTSNFQSGFSNSSNNTYNHLETDDYNITSFPTRQGERNNVYDSTTQGNLDYDSTTQTNGTTESDDMYNRLSQNENNYDSTTQVNGTTESDDMYNHLYQNENNYDSTSNTRNIR